MANVEYLDLLLPNTIFGIQEKLEMTTIFVIIYAAVILLAYRFGRNESKYEMDKLQADNMQLTGEVWRLTMHLHDIERPENVEWLK
jgi:hypothetical protein